MSTKGGKAKTKIHCTDNKPVNTQQRPVSSMSSTGSATSGDSGFGFGGESPVQFICTEQMPNEDKALLTISEFIPAMEAIVPNNFSDFSTDNYRDSNSSTPSFKSAELIPTSFLIRRHSSKLSIGSSNSSPCFGNGNGSSEEYTNVSTTTAIIKQQGENASTGVTLPLPYPPITLAGAQLIQTIKQNSTKNTISDLSQYINPEIHNNGSGNGVDAANAGMNQKMNRLDAYKTVMCQAWLESVKCPFGENCKFAHGEGELRPLVRSPSRNVKYKTKLCEKYTTTGICPYGGRCLFIHPSAKNGNSASQYLNMSRFETGSNKQAPGMLMKQQTQFDFFRKFVSHTNSSHQLLNANAAGSNEKGSSNNSTFSSLPNSSQFSNSMPSVLMDVKASMTPEDVNKMKDDASIQKEHYRAEKTKNQYATWSEAVLFNNNMDNHVDDEDESNGSRPHPSWPLEPPGFFTERQSSSDIPGLFLQHNQQQIKNEVSRNIQSYSYDSNSDQNLCQKSILIWKKNTFLDQASMLNQRINFGNRFHHQSMPLFNIPPSLLVSSKCPSPSRSTASCKMTQGEDMYDDNNNMSSNYNSEDSLSYKSASSPYGLLQRSSTKMGFNVENLKGQQNMSPLAAGFRPLRKKRFSNGVLHSVTPEYSSQSSCSSCCTSGNSSSSGYLNGAVGRDILAEIWSSSSLEDNENSQVMNPFLEAAAVAAKDFEIPKSLFGSESDSYNIGFEAFEPYYGSASRNFFERDETLRESDMVPDMVALEDEIQENKNFLVEDIKKEKCLIDDIEEITKKIEQQKKFDEDFPVILTSMRSRNATSSSAGLQKPKNKNFAQQTAIEKFKKKDKRSKSGLQA